MTDDYSSGVKIWGFRKLISQFETWIFLCTSRADGTVEGVEVTGDEASPRSSTFQSRVTKQQRAAAQFQGYADRDRDVCTVCMIWWPQHLLCAVDPLSVITAQWRLTSLTAPGYLTTVKSRRVQVPYIFSSEASAAASDHEHMDNTC